MREREKKEEGRIKNFSSWRVRIFFFFLTVNSFGRFKYFKRGTYSVIFYKEIKKFFCFFISFRLLLMNTERWLNTSEQRKQVQIDCKNNIRMKMLTWLLNNFCLINYYFYQWTDNDKIIWSKKIDCN